jgi:cytochrome b
MILATLACLFVITLTGIALDTAENRAGPLAGTSLFRYTHLIVEIHAAATNVALGFIVLHLLGVLVSSRIHGENLVRAMITGKKRVD